MLICTDKMYKHLTLTIHDQLIDSLGYLVSKSIVTLYELRVTHHQTIDID